MAFPHPLAISVPLAVAVIALELCAPLFAKLFPPLGVTLAIRLLQLGVMLFSIWKWNPGSAPFATEKAVLKKALMKGFLWSSAFGVVVGVAGLCLMLFGISPLDLLGKAPSLTPPQLALLFLTGAFVGPVAEEFFFRGILYGALRPMGMVPALAITTLLFAGAHGISGGFPLPQIVGGLLFGAAYEKERHILVPIVIHVLGNSALFTLACF